MRDWFRRLLRPPALDDAPWQRAIARVPFVAALDAERQTKLRALVSRFLHEKAITPIGELALDDVQRIELAALCCLPLIEFGEEGLHGWSQLLVYPDAFRVNRTHEDAAGVLHEWDDELIGEAWETGPVIVSWADVQADLASPRDGFCVVVHEIAHKLDALDGALDGTPPLPRAWQRQWASDFQRAFDDFGKQVDRRRKTAIDPYAAEAPEEFFAVCSEYHFSDPKALRASFPDVASHLARFYGPSPFA
ncbi:zinc-dependent peptidase [Lysobacter sp. KIS68-7]|uniref:M90 family metallopeptidase n=1 Tax=Lysobacter sp. KIS68-7 TaxID=2904252 RepID=UPI001E342C70|nr:M90 family metallopeptidase [Lysobacter sp. KIS68-7]UHQ20142.1 zinc-dependent peptidase [Lysobacter sp. KIS68-7]